MEFGGIIKNKQETERGKIMKFEYKTIIYEAKGVFGGQVNGVDFDNTLNQMGNEG